MAGSYKHCTDASGNFIGEKFSGMIENLGDAHEACEEMHAMIRYLSGGDPLKIELASHAFMIEAYPHHKRECDFCRSAFHLDKQP